MSPKIQSPVQTPTVKPSEKKSNDFNPYYSDPETLDKILNATTSSGSIKFTKKIKEFMDNTINSAKRGNQDSIEFLLNFALRNDDIGRKAQYELYKIVSLPYFNHENLAGESLQNAIDIAVKVQNYTIEFTNLMIRPDKNKLFDSLKNDGKTRNLIWIIAVFYNYSDISNMRAGEKLPITNTRYIFCEDPDDHNFREKYDTLGLKTENTLRINSNQEKQEDNFKNDANGFYKSSFKIQEDYVKSSINESNTEKEIQAIPKLRNWGYTCFINSCISFIATTLDQNQIDELRKLNEENNENQDGTNNLRKEMRSSIIALWDAFHDDTGKNNNNIEQLQKDFIDVCIKCGKQNGNDPVFSRFHDIFKDVKNPGEIKMHDANELLLAIKDFVFPEDKEEHINIVKTKTILDALTESNDNLTYNYQKESLNNNIQINLSENQNNDFPDSISELIFRSQEERISDEFEFFEHEKTKYPCRVTKNIVFDSNTNRFSVNINPYDNKKNKIDAKTINKIFAKDSLSLKLPLTNEETGIVTNATFKPVSMICHKGSIENGHYITISFPGNNQCIVHNDQNIQKMKIEDLNQYLNDNKFSPYVIEYGKEV